MDDRRLRTAVVHDPHPLWLDALRRVLDKAEIGVVGSATSPDEAMTLVAETKPDLLVADVAFSGSATDPLSVVRAARHGSPDVRIIVLSASDKPEDVSTALAAGAVAYVVKTASPDDVAFAVRNVFEPSLYLASRLHAEPAEALEPASGAASRLTTRELEILRLVAEGHSNVQLARMLWVTEQTVKFHLSNIYRKLGVANRTEASRWAQTHGILSRPDADGARAASPG
jgi:two-component system nitrate/nitrite response regulator NarL